jgi:ATP-binding cassette, subfamily B, bacterial
VVSRLRGREEWKFFAVLPRASRGLCWAWWLLVVSRGALPGLFSITVGAVVTAVSQDKSLTGPLAAAGAVFVAIQFLAPLHGQVGVNLGDRLACWLHDRLLLATTEPAGVAHLERAGQPGRQWGSTHWLLRENCGCSG